MNRRTAFYVPNLGGGGAQRVVINLTQGFVERRRFNKWPVAGTEAAV